MLILRIAAVLSVASGCGVHHPCPPKVDEAPCIPYIEAAELLDIPPAGSLTFEPGTPLAISARAPKGGRYEMSLEGNSMFRGFGGGRVYFGQDVSISKGIVAHKGAPALLRGGDERTAVVRISNGTAHRISCAALAHSAPTARLEPIAIAAGRVRVTDGSAYIAPAEAHAPPLDDSTIWMLGIGESVELVSRSGDRAVVRKYSDGYTYEGVVVVWRAGSLMLGGGLLKVPESPEPFTIEGQPEEYFATMPLSDSVYDMLEIGEPCQGEATVRSGVPLMLGPLSPRTPSDTMSVREIASFQREMTVKVLARSGGYRSIEIAHPAAGIASIVAWVRANDLTAPTCKF